MKIIIPSTRPDTRHWIYLVLASLILWINPVQANELLVTGTMNEGRSRHVETKLCDGRVLIIGGAPVNNTSQTNSTEIYDPQTGQFSLTGSMSIPRHSPSALLLPDCRVLVVGGLVSSFAITTSTTEIFDPETNSWSMAGNMTIDRGDFPPLLLLSSGRVLVFGGTREGSFGEATDRIDEFDMVSETWSQIGVMSRPRRDHASLELGDGRVLSVGGIFRCCGNPNNPATWISAEIFDATTNTSTALAGQLPFRHARLVFMENITGNRTLIFGGNPDGFVSIFDIGTETFSNLNSSVLISDHPSFAKLHNGKLLIYPTKASGDPSQPLTAAIFNPSNNSISTIESPTTQGQISSATLLNDGKVLIAGGNVNATGSTEAMVFEAESLSTRYIDSTTINDLNGDARSEVVILRQEIGNPPIVIIKDPVTDTVINSITFHNADWDAVAVSVGNYDSVDLIQDVAVLSVNRVSGSVKVQVRDANSDALIETTNFIKGFN